MIEEMVDSLDLHLILADTFKFYCISYWFEVDIPYRVKEILSF